MEWIDQQSNQQQQSNRNERDSTQGSPSHDLSRSSIRKKERKKEATKIPKTKRMNEWMKKRCRRRGRILVDDDDECVSNNNNNNNDSNHSNHSNDGREREMRDRKKPGFCFVSDRPKGSWLWKDRIYDILSMASATVPYLFMDYFDPYRAHIICFSPSTKKRKIIKTEEIKAP